MMAGHSLGCKGYFSVEFELRLFAEEHVPVLVDIDTTANLEAQTADSQDQVPFVSNLPCL
jgi:hypothetical protein